MIGIILLIISIVLYGNNKQWSIILFISFCTNGFNILTNEIIGIKNSDLAFIFTFVICIYSYFFENRKNVNNILDKSILFLFIFLILSAIYSYIHYSFTIYQIFQGGRHLFIFLCYYFLRKVPNSDIIKIISKIHYITLVTSILYIIQVLFDIPTLPYHLEIKIDEATGLGRYYNPPPFIVFYLYLSIFYPQIVKHSKFTQIILIIATLCKLGRTSIALTFIGIIIGVIIKGKLKNIFKPIFIICLCLIPLGNYIKDRFYNDGDTQSDLIEILKGDFKERAIYGNESGGTMSYRLAWIYERMLYLQDRPIGENIFGLGMISDSQTDIVYKKYNFILGLADENESHVVQLTTPDIAYGNMLTQLGYIGSILLITLWTHILIIAFRAKNTHPYIFTLFIMLIYYILSSFSNNLISTVSNLAFPFLIISLIKNKDKSLIYG